MHQLWDWGGGDLKNKQKNKKQNQNPQKTNLSAQKCVTIAEIK